MQVLDLPVEASICYADKIWTKLSEYIEQQEYSALVKKFQALRACDSQIRIRFLCPYAKTSHTFSRSQLAFPFIVLLPLLYIIKYRSPEVSSMINIEVDGALGNSSIPFGKYKGMKLRSLPEDYVHFLLSQGTSTSQYSLDVIAELKALKYVEQDLGFSTFVSLFGEYNVPSYQIARGLLPCLCETDLELISSCVKKLDELIYVYSELGLLK